MNYPLYRDNLCPKLWHMDEDGYRIDDKVRNSLLKIAQDFVLNLKRDNDIDIKIDDIVLIGSIANYNWTDYSDMDLHIITDFKELGLDVDTAQTMFDAIKNNWNAKHDIKMKGHDVELYVQDKSHVPHSTAEYSLLKNKWLKEPKKEKPNFNKELIKRKYKEYKNKINDLVKDEDDISLKKLLDKLYKYRQAGLDSGGELSEENIVFKILRAKGHLDKLKDSIARVYDKKMSVKEIDSQITLSGGGYKLDVQRVANKILDYAKEHGEYPDLNTLFNPLVIKYNKNIDDVHDDVTKAFRRLTSILIEFERIDDGIYSPDGKLVQWDYDKDMGEFNIVPTDDGGANRFFKVYGMKVYGAYVVNPKAVHAMKTSDEEGAKAMEAALVNLRKAVKHPEHGQGSRSIVRDLVKLSVKRLFSNSEYDASKITVIIPLGSKSKLNYAVANEVKKYVPDAVILEDFLKKDKWKNVKLSKRFWNDYNRIKKSGRDLSYYQYVIRDLESKKKNHGEEEFEIKKVGATNRLYYSMFYVVPEGYSIDLINKIKNANVLMIDDTLEAGATLLDANRALLKFMPKDILTYIFLFGRYTTVPKAVSMSDK